MEVKLSPNELKREMLDLEIQLLIEQRSSPSTDAYKRNTINQLIALKQAARLRLFKKELTK